MKPLLVKISVWALPRRELTRLTKNRKRVRIMKARRKRKNRSAKSPGSPLREFMDCCVQVFKSLISANRDLMTDHVLYLVDGSGQPQVIELTDPQPKAQYEKVKSLCNEHRSQLAVYIVPAFSTILNTENLISNEDLSRQIHETLCGHEHCPPLLVPQSVPVRMDVEVTVHPCIYFYGATRDEKVALTMRYDPKGTDYEGAQFDDLHESHVGYVTTRSGNTVSMHYWFEGVQWSPLSH